MALGVVRDGADGAVQAMGEVGNRMGGGQVNQAVPMAGTVAGYPIASLAIGVVAVTLIFALVVM